LTQFIEIHLHESFFNREFKTGIKIKSRVHKLPHPRIPAFDILEAFPGLPINVKPRTRASHDLVSCFCEDILILDNNCCIIPLSAASLVECNDVLRTWIRNCDFAITSEIRSKLQEKDASHPDPI
jgi:hypothetical protein